MANLVTLLSLLGLSKALIQVPDGHSSSSWVYNTRADSPYSQELQVSISQYNSDAEQYGHISSIKLCSVGDVRYGDLTMKLEYTLKNICTDEEILPTSDEGFILGEKDYEFWDFECKTVEIDSNNCLNDFGFFKTNEDLIFALALYFADGRKGQIITSPAWDFNQPYDTSNPEFYIRSNYEEDYFDFVPNTITQDEQACVTGIFAKGTEYGQVENIGYWYNIYLPTYNSEECIQRRREGNQIQDEVISYEDAVNSLITVYILVSVFSFICVVGLCFCFCRVMFNSCCPKKQDQDESQTQPQQQEDTQKTQTTTTVVQQQPMMMHQQPMPNMMQQMQPMQQPDMMMQQPGMMMQQPGMMMQQPGMMMQQPGMPMQNPQMMQMQQPGMMQMQQPGAVQMVPMQQP